MYQAKKIVKFENPIDVNTDMYYVSPTCNFVQQSLNINSLSKLQDDIISRITVLQHNVNSLSNNKADINEHLEISMDSVANLNKIQDDVLNRLKSLSCKIEKIAFDNNIDLYVKSEQTEIAEQQIRVMEKIEILKLEIQALSNQRVKNVAIKANSNTPPLSILLMLKLLNKRGFSIGCSLFNRGIPLEKNSVITKYILKNLSIDKSRDSYQILVSIVFGNNTINECVCHDNVFSDTPLYGEMVIFLYLCGLCGIDMSSCLDNIESINDDLFYQRNVKRGLTTLNSKLIKSINIDTEINLCFSAFVISALSQAKTMEKINKPLKDNIECFLKECGEGAFELVAMK